jgi:hypothetical protein
MSSIVDIKVFSFIVEDNANITLERSEETKRDQLRLELYVQAATW